MYNIKNSVHLKRTIRISNYKKLHLKFDGLFNGLIGGWE